MAEGGGGSACEAAGSWPGESQVQKFLPFFFGNFFGNFFLEKIVIVKHSGGGGAAPPSLNVALHPSYR